jgi:hypothetical protein
MSKIDGDMRRTQIINIGVEIANEGGRLSCVTPTGIADRINLTKQGVLYHFGNQRELWKAIIADAKVIEAVKVEARQLGLIQ